MSDDLVISGLTLWLTLGAVACGALEAATAIEGVGIVVWFGGVVAVAAAVIGGAVWELASGAFRR